MKPSDLLSSPAVRLVFTMCLIPIAVAGYTQEPVLAERQQTELAREILGDDEDLRMRAVGIAQQLGSERMSDEVRFALITLLEQSIDARDEGKAQGRVLSDIVDGEFYLRLARIVAHLNDPRAIPALTRIGNTASSITAARGLASFGEQALPEIMAVIQTPGVSDWAMAHNLSALTIMVENAGANGLSPDIRREIVRVAGETLRYGYDGIYVLEPAINLAIALYEPNLVQMVQLLSQDGAVFSSNSIDQTSERLIREHAADALSGISGGP